MGCWGKGTRCTTPRGWRCTSTTTPSRSALTFHSRRRPSSWRNGTTQLVLQFCLTGACCNGVHNAAQEPIAISWNEPIAINCNGTVSILVNTKILLHCMGYMGTIRVVCMAETNFKCIVPRAGYSTMDLGLFSAEVRHGLAMVNLNRSFFNAKLCCDLTPKPIVYIHSVRLACQPTNQQCFSLISNQHQPPARQQYFSLITNQHQPSATSQTAVLFWHLGFCLSRLLKR